jgi:hypothetical protein
MIWHATCWRAFVMLWAGVAAGQVTADQPTSWRELAAPVVDEKWVRPATSDQARPIWGHRAGLQIGLAPLPGPRGLLRVYAPALGLPEGRVINYIAIEPIPRGDTRRGLSELEPSDLDNRRGKRFWSAAGPDDLTPQSPERPVRGTIERDGDGEKVLVVWIQVEQFANGAHLALRLRFHEARPDEVGIATFAHDDSVPLTHAIVTATMGNFARLRELRLADRIVTAGQLWPEYRGTGFTPHARFPRSALRRTVSGGAIAAATPDEKDPRTATYMSGTRAHWRYEGNPATQWWRCEEPNDELEVLVNGRVVYWGGITPIPGGVSFENFEMLAPFRQGQEFWFGVKPMADADSSRNPEPADPK